MHLWNAYANCSLTVNVLSVERQNEEGWLLYYFEWKSYAKALIYLMIASY